MDSTFAATLTKIDSDFLNPWLVRYYLFIAWTVLNALLAFVLSYQQQLGNVPTSEKDIKSNRSGMKNIRFLFALLLTISLSVKPFVTDAEIYDKAIAQSEKLIDDFKDNWEDKPITNMVAGEFNSQKRKLFRDVREIKRKMFTPQNNETGTLINFTKTAYAQEKNLRLQWFVNPKNPQNELIVLASASSVNIRDAQYIAVQKAILLFSSTVANEIAQRDVDIQKITTGIGKEVSQYQSDFIKKKNFIDLKDSIQVFIELGFDQDFLKEICQEYYFELMDNPNQFENEIWPSISKRLLGKVIKE